MIKSHNSSAKPWKKCLICPQSPNFKTSSEFVRHLREYHCKKEGGSFVCLYGLNSVCNSLPLEGVSDKDYEEHVIKNHVMPSSKGTGTKEKSLISYRKVSKDGGAKSAHPIAYLHPNHQPNLLADQYAWSIYKCTQNLPAVLNDPRKTKRETDFFTKMWGDSFVDNQSIPPSPYIPDIKPEMFDDYLRKIRKRHVPFKKTAKTKELSSSATFHSSEGGFSEIIKVPNIFLRTDFSLANPDTFNAVLPWNYFEKIGNSPRLSSTLLQEKLTHYLDVVEEQIVKQISKRSQEFFNAMSSHDALKEQLSVMLDIVQQLRTKIHSVDDTLVLNSLKVLALRRRQTNCLKVYNKIKLMNTVHQTQPTIQLLLSSLDYVGALDLIRTTQEVLSKELAGILCFRHLGSQLAEIQKVIDKMMHTDFVHYVTADLNRPLTEDASVMEEDQLIAIMSGMLRLETTDFVETFQEEACTAIKATVKQTVIEALAEVDDLDQETYSCKMGDLMHLLQFPTWLDLLNKVFHNVTLILRRIEAFYKVMKSAIDRCDSTSSGGINGEVVYSSSHLLNDSLKKLLVDICNHAHNRCSRLLTARIKHHPHNYQNLDEGSEGDGSSHISSSTVGDKFSPAEFIQLVQRVERFSEDCEAICGRRSPALRLALQTHANKFVSRFHEERKNKLGLILGGEEWKQKDVPPQCQHLVDHMAKVGKIAMPPDRNIAPDIKPKPYLIVDGQKFAVIGSVLMVLEMLVEYCQCAQDVPMLAPDLLTRLLDFLKTFNSQTCQLVLGARAIGPVVRLITARTLALTSRSLQLVAFYLPQLRDTFDKHLLSDRHRSMCKHFSDLSRDYQNHIQLISSKLVSITDNMFENQLSKWEVRPPVPSSSFRNIHKQLAKVHESVADCLTQEQTNQLFFDLHQAFKARLRNHLTRLKVLNDGGPQHGLVTQELIFYAENLHKLKLSIDTSMDDLWTAS